MRLIAEVADEALPAQAPSGACRELDRTDHLLTGAVSRIEHAKKF